MMTLVVRCVVSIFFRKHGHTKLASMTFFFYIYIYMYLLLPSSFHLLPAEMA